MRFSASLVLCAVTSAAVAAAQTAAFSYCTVTHAKDGNTFTAVLDRVPSISMSTICGHTNDHLKADAKRNGVNIKSDLSCSTHPAKNVQNFMGFTVKLDKQSPQSQLEVLRGALTEAFGSQGFDTASSGNCNLAGIPV